LSWDYAVWGGEKRIEKTSRHSDICGPTSNISSVVGESERVERKVDKSKIWRSNGLKLPNVMKESTHRNFQEQKIPQRFPNGWCTLYL
jgi:hypothetical protein